jgi:anthranilate phosphoribosyltransferase
VVGLTLSIDQLLDGAWSNEQQAVDTLSELAADGFTSDTVGALVAGLQARMVPVTLADGVTNRAIDVVGTGGDGSYSINISTLAALVVAAAGYPVVKHGNRAATSRCGSADLLQALGLDLDRAPQDVACDVEECNFGFCFAPRFHPSLVALAPLRRKLGKPTPLNLVGPLLNPARPTRGLLGVGQLAWLALMADVAPSVGLRNAWIVGSPGIDELLPGHDATCVEIRDGVALPAAQHVWGGDEQTPIPTGGDVDLNVTISRQLLDGRTGPAHDVVALNASVALTVADDTLTLDDATELARQTLVSGRAGQLVSRLAQRHQK